MLVEDDHAVAQTLIDALESSSYRVWLAETGADAKILLEQTRPDLIILDLMLPDMDGLVLCSGLKAIADVPIVICRAQPQKRVADPVPCPVIAAGRGFGYKMAVEDAATGAAA